MEFGTAMQSLLLPIVFDFSNSEAQEINQTQTKFENWTDVTKLDLYIRPNRDKPNFAYLHKSAWSKIPQLQFHKPETDAEFRAMTPPGFAKAFFEANR